MTLIVPRGNGFSFILLRQERIFKSYIRDSLDQKRKDMDQKNHYALKAGRGIIIANYR
jgi:hypothetical protein